jgi:hypothetical protein
MNYLGKNIIFDIGGKIFDIGGKMRRYFITPRQTEFAAVASSQTYLYPL